MSENSIRVILLNFGKKINPLIILWTLFVLGIISEILSFLMFNGLWAGTYGDSAWICGSTCDIWLGFRKCEFFLTVCVFRNKYYRLLQNIGFVFLAGFMIMLIFLIFRRKNIPSMTNKVMC